MPALIPLSCFCIFLPKDLWLLVRENRRLDTLQTHFKEVVDGELDRMTDPKLVRPASNSLRLLRRPFLTLVARVVSFSVAHCCIGHCAV